MTIDDAVKKKDKHLFKKIPRMALKRFGTWVENNKSVLIDPVKRNHTAVYIHGMGEVIEEAYENEDAVFSKVQKLKNMLYHLESIVINRSTIDQSLLAVFFTNYKDAFDLFDQKNIKPEFTYHLESLWDVSCAIHFKAIFGKDVNL